MPETKQQRYPRLLLVSALGSLILANCAPTTPVADTNRDGIISDSEITQFRRQQEVRGGQPASTTASKTIRGVRAAREVAGTANTFYWLSRWL